MAEQWPHQQDGREHSMSDGIHSVDVRSLDPEYLSACVLFAQSHGIYPSSSARHPDNDIASNSLNALSEGTYQSTDLAVDHQGPNRGPFSTHDPTLYTSSTFADTSYPQHDHCQYLSPYSETTASDPIYNQRSSSFPISNHDDINLDPSLPHQHSYDPQHQASSPYANDATAPAQARKHHSTPAPTKLPREIPQPRFRFVTNEVGDNGFATLHNYDPLWVQSTGADPNSVFESYSKMKFEKLFLAGVIQKADRLVIRYTGAFLSVVDNGVATLTHVGFSRGSKRNILFPEMALTLSSHPSYLRTISACSGPGAIMTHFAQCNITGPDIGANLARHLHVWRGSQGLGTLKYVRQAYHTWKKDMETDRDGADGNGVTKEGEGI